MLLRAMDDAPRSDFEQSDGSVIQRINDVESAWDKFVAACSTALPLLETTQSNCQRQQCVGEFLRCFVDVLSTATNETGQLLLARGSSLFIEPESCLAEAEAEYKARTRDNRVTSAYCGDRATV